MSYIKPAIIVFAALAISAPSYAQAQGFARRSTGTGAIAGAIIGGLIGAGNDEALAGAAIGGVIGGVTGRALGRSRDAQYGYGGYGQRYYQQPSRYHGSYTRSRNHGVRYAPVKRVSRGGSYGARYPSGRSYYYRGGHGGW